MPAGRWFMLQNIIMPEHGRTYQEGTGQRDVVQCAQGSGLAHAQSWTPQEDKTPCWVSQQHTPPQTHAPLQQVDRQIGIAS